MLVNDIWGAEVLKGGPAEWNTRIWEHDVDTGYRISVFYDLAKVAVNRLAFSQGHELEPHGVTAIAITPGWLRSEMMLDSFGVTETNWRDALDPAWWADTQTPPQVSLSRSHPAMSAGP
ncbi:short chain dehydrogenase [Arthrobacter sp. Hiyo4]|nr:short chain dehydrogenase [Arthrobacter sp. Hiyo4]